MPHVQAGDLRKGDDISSCESCGRLLYWGPHFSEEEDDKRDEATPKAAPPKVRRAPS
ncbi:MAG: hypothetical protein JKY37_04265 [Nannocystaceae bacterium]|nr:hypothetical protein [Nannocystaceae bacterium]